VLWVSPAGAEGVPEGVGGGVVLIVAFVVVVAVAAVVVVARRVVVAVTDCVRVVELVRGVEVVCDAVGWGAGAGVVVLVGPVGCVGLLACVVEAVVVECEDVLAPHPPAARTSTASDVATQTRSRIGPSEGSRRR